MKRGEMHTAALPTVDGAPSKFRPCVIVQEDYYNQRISNTIVVPITSNTKRKDDPAHVFIDISTPEGRASGLNTDSVVSGINVVVVMQKHLQRKIGEHSGEAMKKVDACLKRALGLA